MKRTAVSMSLALPVAFFLGSFSGLPLPSWGTLQEGDVAHAVAVVNLERVLAAYPKYRAGLGDLQKQHDELEKQLDEAKKHLDSLSAARSSVTEGTPAWVTAAAEYESAKAAFAARQDAEKIRMNLQLAETRQQAVAEIQAAIAELAQRRHVQLVLRDRDFVDDPRLKDGDQLQVNMQLMEVLGVLYHAPALDMTDDVVRYLTAPAAATSDGN